MNAQQYFNACFTSGCKFSTAPSLVQPNLVLLHYPLTQTSASCHNVFLFSFVLVIFFFFKVNDKIFSKNFFPVKLRNKTSVLVRFPLFGASRIDHIDRRNNQKDESSQNSPVVNHEFLYSK